ncbi:hypothetical protein [Variovorax sp. E3]|uniref:hypothetical protein n=1 Tax=Variovorax sp. E3 TaxID=1914993 RepID=UPI0022B6E9C3|nr:hypothetical protein [Variovorax sp. E3]
MKQWLRAQGGWWLAWLALTAVGAVWIARAELAQMHQDFETDVRIAHRLMSQQMVQYDAVLATLALLEPSTGADHPEQRLPSVYSSILRVQRRERDEPWPDAGPAGVTPAVLAAAEARSRGKQRADLASIDLARGRYVLVIGATPFSYALDIDLAGSVPWRDWPMNPQVSPVRLSLQRDGQQLVLQPGRPATGGWHFGLTKRWRRRASPSTSWPSGRSAGTSCRGAASAPGPSRWRCCWPACGPRSASALRGGGPKSCCGSGRSRGSTRWASCRPAWRTNSTSR